MLVREVSKAAIGGLRANLAVFAKMASDTEDRQILVSKAANGGLRRKLGFPPFLREDRQILRGLVFGRQRPGPGAAIETVLGFSDGELVGGAFDGSP